MAAVKFSELNSNQKIVYRIVIDECSNYIGGYENQLDDNQEGTEDWQEAYDALHKSHEELVDIIMRWVRGNSLWECNEHLHFVSLEWIRERIDRRLKKWGY